MKTVIGRRATLALVIGPKSSTSRRYSLKVSAPVLNYSQVPPGWRFRRKVQQRFPTETALSHSLVKGGSATKILILACEFNSKAAP